MFTENAVFSKVRPICSRSTAKRLLKTSACRTFRTDRVFAFKATPIKHEVSFRCQLGAPARLNDDVAVCSRITAGPTIFVPGARCRDRRPAPYSRRPYRRQPPTTPPLPYFRYRALLRYRSSYRCIHSCRFDDQCLFGHDEAVALAVCARSAFAFLPACRHRSDAACGSFSADARRSTSICASSIPCRVNSSVASAPRVSSIEFKSAIALSSRSPRPPVPEARISARPCRRQTPAKGE